MRILVTGSAGFLGSHFRKALFDRDEEVYGVDIWSGAGDCMNIFNSTESGFDAVFHCAAVPHTIDVRTHHPDNLYRNIEIDAAMFRWASLTHTRVVYFSSCVVYNPATHRHAETDRIDNPGEFYGWSKRIGERMAEELQEMGGEALVVRVFSAYGTDQSIAYPFRAMIQRAILREHPFVIWGNGAQRRDFIHVDDVVEAVLRLFDAKYNGTPINIGTGRGTSMMQLAEKVCRARDPKGAYDPIIQLRLDRPAGLPYLVANIDNLRDVWVPQITLDEGIRRAYRESGINK